MNTLRLSLPLFLSAAVVASGCATSAPTTPADYMRGHATDQQADVDQQKQYADDWEEGKNLVSEGNKDVKNGSEKVRDGEESIKDGNA